MLAQGHVHRPRESRRASCQFCTPRHAASPPVAALMRPSWPWASACRCAASSASTDRVSAEGLNLTASASPPTACLSGHCQRGLSHFLPAGRLCADMRRAGGPRGRRLAYSHTKKKAGVQWCMSVQPNSHRCTCTWWGIFNHSSSLEPETAYMCLTAHAPMVAHLHRRPVAGATSEGATADTP
eukprot:363974-Chlamydomonas_euryale.AAC.12